MTDNELLKETWDSGMPHDLHDILRKRLEDSQPKQVDRIVKYSYCEEDGGCKHYEIKAKEGDVIFINHFKSGEVGIVAKRGNKTEIHESDFNKD